MSHSPTTINDNLASSAKFPSAKRRHKSLFAIGLMCTTTVAMAHAGHTDVGAYNGYMSGLLHPILGLDHLLAMLGIGFWSMSQNVTMKRVTPLFVVGGMVFGALLAIGGMTLPLVETGIALSVLLIGLLIATLAKLPTAVGGSLVVGFMLLHGFAHGTEMATGSSIFAYMAGFVIATVAITYVGRGLGAVMMRADNRLVRLVGAVLAVIGGTMVMG